MNENELLTKAMRMAVAAKMLPENAPQNDYIRNWDAMQAILRECVPAPLTGSDEEAANAQLREINAHLRADLLKQTNARRECADRCAVLENARDLAIYALNEADALLVTAEDIGRRAARAAEIRNEWSQVDAEAPGMAMVRAVPALRKLMEVWNVAL